MNIHADAAVLSHVAAIAAPFDLMCIDDNTALVDALERRMALEPGFKQLHRPSDFTHAISSVAAVRPTIVVLDVELPDGVDSLSILAGIVEQVPESRVIILTGHPSGELVAKMMSVGAWGFVSKGVRADRLIDAIRRVLRGEAVIELQN